MSRKEALEIILALAEKAETGKKESEATRQVQAAQIVKGMIEDLSWKF